MLGTNDTKTQYSRTAEDIALALNGLMDDVVEYAHDNQGNTPKIVVVSPIHINDATPHFSELYAKNYDHSSAETSRQLAEAIKTVAQKRACTFVDASQVAEPGEDGVHFDKDSHERFARTLERTIAIMQ